MVIESKFDIGQRVKVIKPTKEESKLETYNITQFGDCESTITDIILKKESDEIFYRLERVFGTIPEKYLERIDENRDE